MTSEKTALYRHYDCDGRLLYVGISLSVVARLASHKHGSPWASNIAHVQVEYFNTREEAEIAEKQAIQCERPLWNTKHNPRRQKKREAAAKPSATPAPAIKRPKPRHKPWCCLNTIPPEFDIETQRHIDGTPTIKERRCSMPYFRLWPECLDAPEPGEMLYALPPADQVRFADSYLFKLPGEPLATSDQHPSEYTLRQFRPIGPA